MEHALAAINNACCSNKQNIDVLHANGGMVSLLITQVFSSLHSLIPKMSHPSLE